MLVSSQEPTLDPHLTCPVSFELTSLSLSQVPTFMQLWSLLLPLLPSLEMGGQKEGKSKEKQGLWAELVPTSGELILLAAHVKLPAGAALTCR